MGVKGSAEEEEHELTLKLTIKLEDYSRSCCGLVGLACRLTGQRGVDEEAKEEVMYLLDLLRFESEAEDVGG